MAQIAIDSPDGQITIPYDPGRGEHNPQVRAAYGGGWPCYCLCKPRGPADQRRLYISNTRSAPHPIVKRYPGTGSQHDVICRWFDADYQGPGRTSPRDRVVRRHDDGTSTIRLLGGLTIRDRPPAPVQTSRSSGASTGGQAAITLRGLVDLLWETARYHTWHKGFAGKRTERSFTYRLQSEAESINVGPKTRLASHLMIFESNPDWRSVERAVAKWQWLHQSKKQVLLLAPMVPIEPVDFSTRRRYITDIAMQFHAVLWSEKSIADEVGRRYERELAAAADAQFRIYGLFRIKPEEPKARKYQIAGQVLECVLTRTTRNFIPVASHHEARVADKLCDEGRSFSKPLRYDDVDVIFPDFILHDTSQPWPMEVFGMATEDYLQRRAEKEAYLRGTFGSSYWVWDAVKDPTEIPPFPSRRSSGNS